jgi:hypothetical protein
MYVPAPVSSVEEDDVLALADMVRVVIRRLVSSKASWRFAEEGGMVEAMSQEGFSAADERLNI